MELELALKITRIRDDITPTADVRITKGPFSPIFSSRETSKMFILTAHLKGFRRENIHIEISKDGNRMEISGTKPVQEMELKGWILCKKEVEIRAFRKVFQIPDVVDLDRTKAKYNEEESALKIVMPKKVRGIFGFEIVEEQEEEPKKKENVDDGKEETKETKIETTQEVIDQREFEEQEGISERDGLDEEEKDEKMVLEEPPQNAIKEDLGKEPEEPLVETMEETKQIPEEPEKPKQPEPDEEPKQEVHPKEEIEEREDEIKEEHESDMPEELEKQEGPIEKPTPKKKKRKKLCAPCMFAGSAFLISLIIMVFHLIRAKKRS